MIVSCVGVGKYVSGAVRYVEMSWPKLNFPNLASTSFLAASSAYIFVAGRYTMLVRCHKCRKRSADLRGGSVLPLIRISEFPEFVCLLTSVYRLPFPLRLRYERLCPVDCDLCLNLEADRYGGTWSDSLDYLLGFFFGL